MKKTYFQQIILINAIFFLLLIQGQADADKTASQIAKEAFPSVLTLIMEDELGRPIAQGSGFIVDQGIVATNYHVIKNKSGGIAILIGKNTEYKIEGYFALDKEKDLVLLSIPDLKAPPLTLGDSKIVEIGDKVYAIGTPELCEGTFSEGIISGIRKTETFNLFQMTAPISHGSSGGPVLDKNGQVIGIACAGLEEGQNLNFAIPISYLKDLMLNKKDKVEPLSPPKKTTPIDTEVTKTEITKEIKPLQTFSGHSNGVSSVVFSPDGKTLASGSKDTTIKLWSVDKGECFRTLSGHSIYIWSVAFSPDGKTLTSGSSDCTIKFWSVDSGECLRTLDVLRYASSIVFSPDGKTLASGCGDTTIKLWSADKGECLRTLSGHFTDVLSVAYSPDGKTLASGSADKTIKLWSVDSGECLRTFSGHSGSVNSVAFSPDGKTLASGSTDKTIILWSVESGTCIRKLSGHSLAVLSVAFSPDGHKLASGSLDHKIKLWTVDSGECLHTLSGHSDFVDSVAFSPDGSKLASGSWDKTINLWSVEE